jgi:hypothetical protein
MNDYEKELALWETIRELAEGRAITLVNASKIVNFFKKYKKKNQNLKKIKFRKINNIIYVQNVLFLQAFLIL